MAKFEENRKIISFNNAVAFGVDFETPAQSVALKRIGINGIRFSLQLGKIVDDKTATVITRNYFARTQKYGYGFSMQLVIIYLLKSARTGAVTKFVIGFFLIELIILDKSLLLPISSERVDVWS